MGLSDWTEQKGASYQGQSNDQALDQTYSWKMDQSSNDKILTWDQSGADAPIEAVLEAGVYAGADGASWVFNYQDNGNLYFVEFGNTVALRAFDGGSLVSNIDDANITINQNQWNIVRMETYEDSGGAFNIRVEIDTDTDGTFDSGPVTLSESSRRFGGGAVGFLNKNGTSGVSRGPYYYDEWRVEY